MFAILGRNIPEEQEKHRTDIRVPFFNATAGALKDNPGLLELCAQVPELVPVACDDGYCGWEEGQRGTVEWLIAEGAATHWTGINANTTFSLVVRCLAGQ